jgi:hypothetical protein
VEQPRDDTRSIAELVKQLLNDGSALARAELDRAKAEMAQRSGKFATGIGLFAGAALFVVIAIACLVAACVAALALVVPTWLAAVIVALVALVTTAILALVGRSTLRKVGTPVPVDSIAAAKEDIAWLKNSAAK